MAIPTAQELRNATVLLAERIGYAKLYDRLVRLNAFVSRRKPPSPEALADRLYNLTGGLRRQVPATLAFQSVWAENVSNTVGEENDKRLEEIANRINATLTSDERAIQDGKLDELDTALGEYEQVLADLIGADAARIDMVLKAVPPVAERLRARPTVTGSGTTAAAAPE
jgi:hypothetical protein